MKRLSLLLLSAWMTLGLFAQSWSPNDEGTWTQEHATTIIDFQLEVDGSVFQHTAATHSPNFTIAAIVDGQYRGKATNVIRNDASGMAIGSYFSMTVYGITDPTTKQNTLAGKEITLHLYDAENKLEYILPQTFTFDGEHHGTLDALEEVSYTTVTRIALTNRYSYPGKTFKLSEPSFALVLYHDNTQVSDGTKLVIDEWYLDTDLTGYTMLDSKTGEMSISEDAEVGTVTYGVRAGSLTKTALLYVYNTVQEIEILQDPADVLVGTSIDDVLTEGLYFDILPNTAMQTFTYELSNPDIVREDNTLQLGETEVTITSRDNREVSATFTLRVFDDATSISVSQDVIYMPSTTEDVKAFLAPYITIDPETAKQDFEFASFNGDIFQIDNFGKLSIIGTGESRMMVVPALYTARVSASFTVVVYDPVAQVNILRNPVDVLVGEGFNDKIVYGGVFNFTDASGSSTGVWNEFTYTLSDASIVNSDGMFDHAQTGVILTISPVTNPEVKGRLTLNVYDPVESISYQNVRIPNTLQGHDAIYAAIMSQVTIEPVTAKQDLPFDDFTGAVMTIRDGVMSLTGATGPANLYAKGLGCDEPVQIEVEVYAPITNIVIYQDPLDMLVGESALKTLPNNFSFEPTEGIIDEYTIEYSDPTVIDDEGFIAKAVPEGVTVTVTSVTNPEVSGTFTLRTYDEVKSITVNNETGKVRIPNSLHGRGHAAIYSAIMEQVTIAPETAKQELTFRSSSDESIIAFDWDSKQNPLLKIVSADAVGETDLTAYAYGYYGETEPIIPVEVYEPAGNLEILEASVDAPVGASIYDWLWDGPNGHYQVIPSTADQRVVVTAADPTIMDAEGNILAKGSTTITLTSAINPELSGTMTLNAYIQVTDYELYDGDVLLWSSVDSEDRYGYIDINMDRLNKKTITVKPIPADADMSKPLEGGNLTVWNYSEGDFGLGVEVETAGNKYHHFKEHYNEAGEIDYATFTLHGWQIGWYNLTFEEDASGSCICEMSINVGADVHPVQGWDWVSIHGDYYPDDNNSLNYLNDAEHYGGGLIDVRSKEAHLYKDPTYGLYGTLEYMSIWDAMCYKMKFDRSQATLMENDYFILYETGGEGGAGPTWCPIEKGWSWMGYPWQFDYTMTELDIMDYSNKEYIYAADGDVILASDGSMLVFDGATEKWRSSEGEDFTFRYGKGYLYYTTLEAEHSGFEWGIGRELEPKDLTTAEARARKFDRDASFWDYNPHQYPNHMAIIAKLEGIDNLEDFSIGAFVDDECRGEGKAAEEWMFITVNGDDKEYVTFRLIDKRTGICYDLSESFQFGGVSGSLKDPVIFRTGDIASGIANVTEGNALIVQGNVATAAGTIQVYDIQGKVVAEGFQRIDMSHLNSGVYVVKAGNTSRKVIK